MFVKKYFMLLILVLTLCLSGCNNQSAISWSYLGASDATVLPENFSAELSDYAMAYQVKSTADAPDEYYLYVSGIDTCRLDDGSYFAIKSYAFTMSNGSSLYEIYNITNGECKLLKAIETATFLSICTNKHLYYSANDGVLYRISSDGIEETILDGKIPAPEDAMDKNTMLHWNWMGTVFSGNDNTLTISAVYYYKNINEQMCLYEKSYEIDISKL